MTLRPGIDGQQTLRWFNTLVVYNPDGEDEILIDREEMNYETDTE